MRVLLCGVGESLYYMIKTLSQKGYELVAVCPDQKESVILAQSFDLAMACGDPTDERLLEEVGVKESAVLISLFPKDSDNYVVVNLVLQRFKVPTVITLVNNPANEEIYQQMGGVRTLCPPKLLGNFLAERDA